MKEKILNVLGVIVLIAIGLGINYWVTRPSLNPAIQSPSPNPFTKIGNMATTNGLVVEIYSLEHEKAKCVVAIQQYPHEAGRAMFQMVCK